MINIRHAPYAERSPNSSETIPRQRNVRGYSENVVTLSSDIQSCRSKLQWNGLCAEVIASNGKVGIALVIEAIVNTDS